MGYSSYENIKVKGIEALKTLEELEINILPNRHAQIRIKGIADEEICTSYINESMENRNVLVEDTSAPEKAIFNGQITSVNVHQEGGLYHIEVKGVSGSYKLDLEKKNRSFQHTSMTYGQMIKEVIYETPQGDAIFQNGEDEQINIPIIQYRETAWEFTKRMASHFGAAVVPEVISGKPRLWFGMPDGKSRELEKDIEYKVYKDINRFNAMGGESAGYDVNDFFFYEIKTWQNFNLGDTVNFRNKKVFICSKNVKIHRDLLEYTYTLGNEAAVGLKIKYNSIISGMSIKGTVLDTHGERIRLHLDIDKYQDPSKAFWYPWVPITGNMMYCMPQIGTKAVLYFPDEDENNAKITSCVRTNGGDCEHTSDPNNRYLTTEHNKNVSLLPQELSFCCMGNNQNPFLGLQDASGISLKSDKGIGLYANGKINLSAGNIIMCEAKKELHAYIFDGSGSPISSLDFKFDINLKSKTVCIIASVSNPQDTFTDVPEKFDSGKFWRNVLIGAAIVLAAVAAAVVICACPVAAVGILGMTVGQMAVGAAIGTTIAVGLQLKTDYDSGEPCRIRDLFIAAFAGAVAGALGAGGSSMMGNILYTLAGNEAGLAAKGIANMALGGDQYVDGEDFIAAIPESFVGGAVGSKVGDFLDAGEAQAIKGMDDDSIKNLTNKLNDRFLNNFKKLNPDGFKEATGGRINTIGKLQLKQAYKDVNETGESNFLYKYEIEAPARSLVASLKDDVKVSNKSLYNFIRNNPDLYIYLEKALLKPQKYAVPLAANDIGADALGILIQNENTSKNKKPTEVFSDHDGKKFLVRGAKLICKRGNKVMNELRNIECNPGYMYGTSSGNSGYRANMNIPSTPKSPDDQYGDNKCGSNERLINLPKDHGTYIKNEDAPLLCENDKTAQNGPDDSTKGKNIMFFGVCCSPLNPSGQSVSYVLNTGKLDSHKQKVTKRVDGKPCTPIILNGWKETKKDVLINGAAALTTKSWLQCKYGGVISVKESGQKEEDK